MPCPIRKCPLQTRIVGPCIVPRRRNKFTTLQEALVQNAEAAPRMKRFLYQCMERIGQSYLLESYYFVQ
ncbi:hypothetical protein [Desulfovibrio cuneatus]|uniref:hypothetical protein n=1 Tax=Desulfovibrio cuneatus TaxID=159728 RepID=UPI0003FBDBCC|nr:hypothetical protein [Desulfovibrio cuneatus]